MITVIFYIFCSILLKTLVVGTHYNLRGNIIMTLLPFMYSKTCVKRLIKIDKIKVLMTNGSLMKV